MLQYVRSRLLPYLRTQVIPSKPAQLLIQTWLKWDRDNVPGMAAALSYYALFSLFPLLLVILGVVGALVGPDSEALVAMQEIIVRYLPPEVHDLIKDTIVALNENSVGAGLIGFGILLFAASTIFAILKRSVNKIWETPSRVSEAGSPVRIALFFVVNKLSAFVLVIATALLLLASLLSQIVIKVILTLVNTFQATFDFLTIDEAILGKSLEASWSFLALGFAIAGLFRILPSIKLSWRDIWPGALLTTLLLAGLQWLVSNSVITLGSRFVSYGVIGSVMILMLWIFLACQIFFAGCEFSFVYAHLFGTKRRTARFGE
ncbi:MULTISPECIES: YihY/virulence factor BrkB family protein [Cyanophyceae]|uniref:YihY/virulence factor BrkB family protein n=1 Tax=Leptolyngbya subtilissima DQ-A4 TaxID=2933933 RepID=A0ABV0KBV2_9CYAN|nr:YihY/virulence factor BrkB family protein [Nodosilinea sp. FACHB-141]MBD2114914.1 YihY/virulence factor BrkB family protein [Nodosilinea sp. FACHB-141]